MLKRINFVVLIGAISVSSVASAQMGLMKARKDAKMQTKEAKAARMDVRGARMDRNMARRDLKNAKMNMDGTAMEARKELKEARGELRDARMDARKETKEARKARRKATRKNAYNKLQKRLNMGMGAGMGANGMATKTKVPPRVRNELKRHSRRVAKLQRMRSLAQAKDKTELVTKIDGLMEKEVTKHQTRLNRAIEKSNKAGTDADGQTEEAE